MRARHRWAVFAALLLAVHSSPSAVSAAGGINVRWTRCYGEGSGVANKTFACASNTGTNILVLSFEPPQDVLCASGMEFSLNVVSDGATLPAWWMFKNPGTCRQTSLGFNVTANPSDVACVDWSAGQAAGGIGLYTVGAQGPNTALIKGAIAVPVSALTDLFQGTEYFTANITINNQKTVGTGTCAGCMTPVCVGFSSLKISTGCGGNQSYTLTGAAHAGSNYVHWQGVPQPPLVLCTGDTAGFSITTAVLGRGQVNRSRYKNEYPPGSPISLTALPSPGDRFVTWSGDTSTVAPGLDIVVTENKDYTARFERDPASAAVLQSVQDEPGDQGSQVRLKWARSPLDDPAYPGVLSSYELRRQPAGNPGLPWDLVGTVPGNASAFYEHLVATTSDSTFAGTPDFRFRVIGKAPVDSFTWTSNEAIGHSVDNLAPAAPSSVSGTMASGFATLFWPDVNAPDLLHYAIYRSLVGPPPIDLAHRVATTTTLGYNDAPGSYAYYKVTGVDVHGNEGLATDFVPQNTTGTGDRPAPRALTLSAPSPSSGTAAIVMGFPREGHAVIDVHDAQGRTIRRLFEGSRPAGWLDLRWDARDTRGNVAPAGIYFVQARTSVGDRTLRLVLLP